MALLNFTDYVNLILSLFDYFAQPYTPVARRGDSLYTSTKC